MLKKKLILQLIMKNYYLYSKKTSMIHRQKVNMNLKLKMESK